ncbi:GNAT family N-acetyltransferase [Ekhidna sp. To15]|uniref:GNAT family N-acetyltransferase n=1 Tax=Ekhidna sp. To15 TaxID=3395267 RepID=UPI003F52296E
MIRLINHKIKEEAKQIRQVFQVSYAIEAELLQADDFPPLKRPLENFLNAETTFFGYFEGAELAAVTEVKAEDQILHIHSLVVDPDFFRKGIASKLLEFVFNEFNLKTFTVETGAANGPAIALYEHHGFRIIRQWMTEIGIEKVAFEKQLG